MANTVAAPVANSFATKASKFLPLLDEVYKRDSLSAILDTASARVNWIGAKTVNVLKLDLNGNANYDRNAGYVPGSATGVWEPLTLSIDRGRSFLLDAMDADERRTAVVLTGGLTRRLSPDDIWNFGLCYGRPSGQSVGFGLW